MPTGMAPSQIEWLYALILTCCPSLKAEAGVTSPSLSTTSSVEKTASTSPRSELETEALRAFVCFVIRFLRGFLRRCACRLSRFDRLWFFLNQFGQVVSRHSRDSGVRFESTSKTRQSRSISRELSCCVSLGRLLWRLFFRLFNRQRDQLRHVSTSDGLDHRGSVVAIRQRRDGFRLSLSDIDFVNIVVVLPRRQQLDTESARVVTHQKRQVLVVNSSDSIVPISTSISELTQR